MQDCLFGDPAYVEGMGHDGWPSLVGVGSVCRRQLSGEIGLMRVIDTLEGILPSHVQLHLFGIKSAALSKTEGPTPHSERGFDGLEQRRQVGGLQNHTTQRKNLYVSEDEPVDHLPKTARQSKPTTCVFVTYIQAHAQSTSVA
jgi:hypothetical protein